MVAVALGFGTPRVTTVRTADGAVVITRNGQITQVTSLSRDWHVPWRTCPCPGVWSDTTNAAALGPEGRRLGAARTAQGMARHKE